MNIKPVPGFVLLEVLKDDSTTQSGFALPEASQEKPAKGRVIEAEDFDTGDIVIYRRYKGHEIKENLKDYIFVEVKDIVGYYG